VHVLAQVIELSSLRVSFEVGPSAFELQTDIIQDLLEADVPEKRVETLGKCPSWPHEDIDISFPEGSACQTPGPSQVVMHFDGACFK
jgi:hypothetical protein